MAGAQSTYPQGLLVVPTRLHRYEPTRSLRLTPAWLISSAVHIALLFSFFQITLASPAVVPPIEIEPLQSDVTPEEPDVVFVPVEGLDPVLPPGLDREAPEPVVSAVPDSSTIAAATMPSVGQPSGLEVPRGFDGALAIGSSSFLGQDGPFGLGSGGVRSAGAAREMALQSNGGSAASEAAVAKGLRWLALHQAGNGRWSLNEFNQHGRDKPLPAGRALVDNCTGQATRANDIAATAFALLPFLAAGMTHKPSPKQQAEYAGTVRAGLNFLLNKQGPDGYFGGDMYSHGLAAIAMCEAYGMTTDPLLKVSAQKAVNFIVQAQDPAGGGWRYAPRTPGDMSVTGWQVMALKSGQMAGLGVPAACLKKAEQFLDSVELPTKGRYSYTPGSGVNTTLTAAALLCRQYLGVNARNPGLLAGVTYVFREPPVATNNIYYLYYATQVMFHMGGDSWEDWNVGFERTGERGIRDTLLRRQDVGSDPKRPGQLGSWGPAGTGFEKEGGRIMATSLSLLTLEVYYRYLPLYRRDRGVIKNGQ